MKLRGNNGRLSWLSVGNTGGSHELNSATQFWMVFTGTTINTLLALVLHKNTSEKAHTWNVFPKPIEWAKIQPRPGDVEYWFKFSTTLSYRKRMPPIWCGFAARANCGAKKMSFSSAGWPTFTKTRPSLSGLFNSSRVWRPKSFSSSTTGFLISSELNCYFTSGVLWNQKVHTWFTRNAFTRHTNTIITIMAVFCCTLLL